MAQISMNVFATKSKKPNRVYGWEKETIFISRKHNFIHTISVFFPLPNIELTITRRISSHSGSPYVQIGIISLFIVCKICSALPLGCGVYVVAILVYFGQALICSSKQRIKTTDPTPSAPLTDSQCFWLFVLWKICHIYCSLYPFP